VSHHVFKNAPMSLNVIQIFCGTLPIGSLFADHNDMVIPPRLTLYEGICLSMCWEVAFQWR
jgi:hypothetical protein